MRSAATTDSADGGGPRRKLTSKNLFDDVFAAIPATSFLPSGPQSLMEEIALQGSGDGTRPVTGAGNGEASDLNDDEDMLAADGIGARAPSVISSATHRSDTLWTTGVSAVGRKAGRMQSGAPPPLAVGGSGLRLQLDIDAEDEAFKEATKHAALLSEFQAIEAQQDAERAERHRLRMAEQVAAMVGEEERKGVAPFGANEHGDRRSGGGGRLHANSHHGGGREGDGRGGGRYPGSGTTYLQPQGHTNDVAGSAAPANAAAAPNSSGTGGLSSLNGGEGEVQQMQQADGMGPAPLVNVRRQMTAEEQLMLMPPGLSRLYTGRCVMLRSNRGYGFIAPDLGGPDVYFIKDSVMLTFTRLALQAFYIAHRMDIPDAAKLPAERWDAPELTGDGELRGPLVVSSLSDLSPRPPPAAAASRSAADTDTAKSAETASGEGEEGKECTTAKPLAPAGETDGSPAAVQWSPVHHPATFAAASGSMMVPLAGGGVMPGLVVGMGRETNPIPPITPAELEMATKASALLTRETAQLLQWAMDNTLRNSGSGFDGLDGGGGLLGHLHDGSGSEEGGGGGDPGGVVVNTRDPLTFTVQRNRATGGSSRLLRAEFIRGTPETAFALPLEQSWFHPLFPGAVGVKAADAGGAGSMAVREGGEVPASDEGRPLERRAGAATPASPEPGSLTILPRYTGMIRAYNAEDKRGYIRCDEPGARQDVCFYASAFLWEPALPSAQHLITERLRVVYSVAGMDRNGKYLATLVTSGKDGKPFGKENVLMEDDERDGRGGGRRGGGGGGGGGAAGMRDEVAHAGLSASGMDVNTGSLKRSRAEEEEQILLFEEDDYAMI